MSNDLLKDLHTKKVNSETTNRQFFSIIRPLVKVGANINFEIPKHKKLAYDMLAITSLLGFIISAD